MEPSTPTTLLSNKVYNVLKWIVVLVLPGAGALYFTLASLWGFPYAEQIVGTISAVTLFLGLILGISTKSYNAGKFDGELVVNTEDPTHHVYSLDVSTPLEQVPNQDTLLLKVVKPSGS